MSCSPTHTRCLLVCVSTSRQFCKAWLQSCTHSPVTGDYTSQMPQREPSKFVMLTGLPHVATICCALIRLWAHEALRIFQDRLVSDDDRRWFANFLKASVQEHLRLPFDEVFAPPGRAPGSAVDVLSATRSLLYCDFLTQVSLNHHTTPPSTCMLCRELAVLHLPHAG